MKSKIVITLFLSLILLCSCKNETLEERINETKLNEGEYYSELNSQNGFSVRDNKIAFFKNMKFGSDDIYEYVLVDSILIDGSLEKKVGTYLKRTYQNDILYTEIDKKSDSIIILKFKAQPEVFKLKTRIVLKPE